MLKNQIIENAINGLMPYSNELHQSARNRANGHKATLDDVRAGLARVDTRGYIKWIKSKKIPKKYRMCLLATAMIQPIMRYLDYQSIARSLFTIEKMPCPTSNYISGENCDG
jgi:hypothetical protein